MTIPVEFNEPLGMLQKSSEMFEYEDLLRQANREKDPVLRIVLVAAFNIAQYTSTENRIAKPFNPLLGETFEFDSPKFRFISEQVSHHPPISACHAKEINGEYEFWMNTDMKSHFWGAYLEVVPIGLTHIKLRDYPDEVYSIKRPNTYVHNMILGTCYLEHAGTMQVTRTRSSGVKMDDIDNLIINFRKVGWV